MNPLAEASANTPSSLQACFVCLFTVILFSFLLHRFPFSTSWVDLQKFLDFSAGMVPYVVKIRREKATFGSITLHWFLGISWRYRGLDRTNETTQLNLSRTFLARHSWVARETHGLSWKYIFLDYDYHSLGSDLAIDGVSGLSLTGYVS
jgi:hypothetical protein